jgi:hypothetical protein
VRAKLAPIPEVWKWGSAFRRINGTGKQRSLLAKLPVDLPNDYRTWIHTSEPAEELGRLRQSVIKAVPYGEVKLPANIKQ